MSNSFQYIDIILLAMIAGFIFLRLRGILGRRTGHEKKVFGDPFSKKVKQKNNDTKIVNLSSSKFDAEAKEQLSKEQKWHMKRSLLLLPKVIKIL